MAARKRITGGWHYERWADQQLARFRAAGLQYLDRTFPMPDASVRIQINGAWDFITITGGGCKLAMDSGIVNVLTINEQFGEVAYRAGVMVQPTHVRNYHAPFTEPVLGPNSRGVQSWKVTPKTDNPVSNGQLAGQISLSKTITGKVPPPTLALSFSPYQTKGTPADPEQWADVKNDSDLFFKKTDAVLCPASMFTGRARLYAQALYGRWLHPNLDDQAFEKPFNFGSEGTRPKLLLTPYKRDNEPKKLLPVSLTTSSGLYLNTNTGEHWLFNPGEGVANFDGTVGTDHGVACYPLVPSACAKQLRKWLILPKVEGNTFSDDDLEHIEAYILSQSMPDYANQRYAFTEAITGGAVYGMGYGWHWNWTGLDAVYVLNEQYAQSSMNPALERGTGEGPGTDYGMRSRTYKLGMVGMQPPEGETLSLWSAVMQVSNDTRWTVDRNFWVILEPMWSPSYLAKIQPPSTSLFPCKGTFYAFYRKNELIECSAELFSRPKQDQSFECSPCYDTTTLGPSPGTVVLQGMHNTIGNDAGFGEWHDFVQPHWDCKFTVGSETYDQLFRGHVVSGQRSEISAKTSGAPVLQFTYNIFGGTNFTYGRPDLSGWPFVGGVWQVYSVPAIPILGGTFQILETGYIASTYNFDATSFIDSYGSYAIMFAPAYDAEAFYIKANSHKLRQESGRVRQPCNSARFGWNRVSGTYLNTDRILREEFAGPSGEVGTPFAVVVPDVLTVFTSGMHLHCRAGVLPTLDFPTPGILDFVNDVLPYEYRTLTSANYSSTVVIPPKDVLAPSQPSGVVTAAETHGVGVDIPPPFEPVLVGWI